MSLIQKSSRALSKTSNAGSKPGSKNRGLLPLQVSKPVAKGAERFVDEEEDIGYDDAEEIDEEEYEEEDDRSEITLDTSRTESVRSGDLYGDETDDTYEDEDMSRDDGSDAGDAADVAETEGIEYVGEDTSRVDDEDSDVELVKNEFEADVKPVFKNPSRPPQRESGWSRKQITDFIFYELQDAVEDVCHNALIVNVECYTHGSF